MSPEELAESIRWEAEQYVPFDINDVNLDYVVLEPAAGETMDVLLVAVKKDKIGDYTSVITQAGKTPVLVDVDAFALQNAYEANYPVEPGRVVALVNIGASVTNVNILSGAEHDLLARHLLRRQPVHRRHPEAAFALLRPGRGPEEGGAVRRPLRSRRSSRSCARSPTTSPRSSRRRSTSSCATTSTEKIDQLFLSGGSSRVVNLDTQLKERFGMPVEIMNPFRQIDITGSAGLGRVADRERARAWRWRSGSPIRHVGDEAA